MKVLDLQCRHGHRFEGWFASHEDCEDQRQRGLLTCPVCEDPQVSRLPSAPRLNLGGAQPSAAPTAASGEFSAVTQLAPAQLQAAWMQMVRHVMAHTEDVGPKFAEEARKIHHGEAAERSIRGQASRADTEALLDEGIEILPLPLPAGLKGPLQ